MLRQLLVLRSDEQHLIADTHIRHFRAVVPQRLSLGSIAFGLRHGLSAFEFRFADHAFMAIAPRAHAILVAAIRGRHQSHDLERARRRTRRMLGPDEIDRLTDFEFVRLRHS